VVTLLVALLACRMAQPDRSAEGKFIPRYGPATPEFEAFRDRLIANQFLDTITARLTDSIRLPKDVTIATAHCAEPNASYEPTARRVTLCYELVEDLSNRFSDDPEAGYLVGGAVLFALMHELGHALVDVLALPITGREEDAVDQLATILLLEQGASGDSLAFGAIGWMITNAESARLDRLRFADDHALDLQRVYNLVCWIWGRDPGKYPQVVEEGWLPDHRRDKCQHEYQLLSASWSRLIDNRIAHLQRLRKGLTECIGCGCLSLGQCEFANPGDRLGRRGPGPRRLMESNTCR